LLKAGGRKGGGGVGVCGVKVMHLYTNVPAFISAALKAVFMMAVTDRLPQPSN